MAATGTAAISNTRTLPCRRLYLRIRTSLKHPRLIGEGGARNRYMRIQWWVVFWRLTVLAQIPIVALVAPERLENVPFSFLLLALALAYTALFAWLSMRSRYASKRSLHLVDLGACALLMLLSHSDKQLFVMTFFSFSSLLARPTIRWREVLPNTLFLSFVYLAARYKLTFDLHDVYHSPHVISDFILYYFWGLGFLGFAGVLRRASALELDAHLEKQRQSYRRHLHDDLGNTLCGLHFRIQSLGRTRQPDEQQGALAFLGSGYQRASQVLKSLLSGLEEEAAASLGDALSRQAEEISRESGLVVNVSLPPGGVDLSPEIRREVLAITREAMMNAAKHARASALELSVSRRSGRLYITVADDGRGIDERRRRQRAREGGMGLKSMRERARLIRGHLHIGGNLKGGTTVTLEVDAQRSRFLGRLLTHDPGQSSSGVYPYLIRVRVMMFIFNAALFINPLTKLDLSLPAIIVVGGLTFDCLAWVVFRDPLYRLCSRRPWVLAIEHLYLSVLLVVTLASGIPLFYALYLGVVVMMNGLFAGPIGNVALTAVLNAGVFISHALSSESSLGQLPAGGYEAALQHMTIFFILAFSAGLASDFVRGLESLQQTAIDRALARQREQLTAETHRQLYDLSGRLGEEISTLLDRQAEGPLDSVLTRKLEQRSDDLKARLREIIRSLEEQKDAPLHNAA